MVAETEHLTFYLCFYYKIISSKKLKLCQNQTQKQQTILKKNQRITPFKQKHLFKKADDFSKPYCVGNGDGFKLKKL